MIAPHTTIPTAHAAIQDPCHMVRATFPCLVTGGSMPIGVNALDWQPAVVSSTATAMAARGAQCRTRRARPRRVFRGGALRLRLTYGLPGGDNYRLCRAGSCSPYRLSWKTVSRSPAAPRGTPAGTSAGRHTGLSAAAGGLAKERRATLS